MFTRRTIKSILVIFCLLFGFSLAYAATLHVPADHETIQVAIDAAEDGDTVLVADGVYFGEGNRDIDFKGKAITLKSENGPGKTIIHCQSSGRGFYFHSGEDESSVVSGFTIKDGKVDKGGAIYCKDSSPTIQNNIITRNEVTDYGPGNLYAYGGGIYCENSFPTIINNIITENICVASTTGYKQTNASGGGIYCKNSSPTISNNVIVNNFLYSRSGGGSVAYGGGIYSTGSVHPMVINTIIWGNDSSQAFQEMGIIYSVVQGGWDDIGNIDAEPLFVDPENGDYHLQPDSPCIDAGNPHPQYNDPDGTRNDMGAYGGPNAILSETQPVISEVSPDHGPTAGGTEVTITGENFVDGATVKFGENIASDIIVVSDTEITASTPATEEVGTVDAAVINPDGQSGVLRNAFTYDTETSGSFTISLHSGLNMISLPVKPQTPYTAKTLADKLDASIILKYDSVNQEFIPYIPGHSTGDGFTIEGGQGYIVNMLEDKQITFTGTVWDNTAAPKRSRRSARPPRSVVSHCVWAFVVAGKLPVELRNSGDLTVSVSSVNRNLYKELPLSNSKFSVAFVNSDQSPVLKAGDLLEITVTDTDERLVAEQQIVVNVDDLAKAYKLVRLRYNPIPEKTMLLQNYPNPFNPETWIPFQLAERTDIKISIYDISGNLVKELKLGECPAGLYISKNRAAHWDGRNNLGEKVSSGVYFYTIHTDKFQSTRRMIVVK